MAGAEQCKRHCNLIMLHVVAFHFIFGKFFTDFVTRLYTICIKKLLIKFKIVYGRRRVKRKSNVQANKFDESTS